MRLTSLVVASLLALGPTASAQQLQNASSQANGLTTTVVTIKSSPGLLAWIVCANPSAATAYVQIFDTTAAVTLGTTVPKIALPFETVRVQGWGPPLGLSMLSGIKIAATTTPTGNTAPSVALNCSLGIQ